MDLEALHGVCRDDVERPAEHSLGWSRLAGRPGQVTQHLDVDFADVDKWNHSARRSRSGTGGGGAALNSSICESLHANMRSYIRGTGNMKFATVQLLTVYYAFWNARQKRGPRAHAHPRL